MHDIQPFLNGKSIFLRRKSMLNYPSLVFHIPKVTTNCISTTSTCPTTTECDKRLIAPSFKSAESSRILSPVTFGGYTVDEKTSDKDRLSVTRHNIVRKYSGYTFYYSWGRSHLRKNLGVIEDGALCYSSKYSRAYQLQDGIYRLPWRASSPDLNLIENARALLRNSLRR